MSYTAPKKRELTQEMGVIYMALDAVTKFMAKWLDDNLKTLSPDYWDRYVVSSLYESQQKTVRDNGAKSLYDLDQPTILSVFLQNKPVLLREFKIDPQLFGYAHSIKDIRNKYFHKNSKPLSERRFRHDLDTICLFLEGLGASQEIINEVNGQFIKESKATLDPELAKDASTSIGTIKISVPQEDKGRDVGASLEKGDLKLDENVGSIRKKQRKMLSNNVPQLSQQNKSQMQSSRRNPKELYESIHNCLKLDFGEYKFGVCALYKPEDKIPEVLSLGTGWQWAIALQIFERDKARVANEVAKFNHVGIKYDVVGDYVVWKYVDSCHVPATPVEIASTVYLPNWYVEAITSIYGTGYQTDRLGVRQTLQASNRVRRLYLGTYAPRSFAEMVVIADYIFALHADRVGGLGPEISICDIGSGSGAATMGLIWSLKKLRLNEIKRIIIYAVDGNETSLKLFEELLPRLRDNWKGVDIVLQTKLVSSVDKIVSACRVQADFVVSSKFIQELQSEELVSRVGMVANNTLKTNGIALWIANPGIDPVADAFMNASRYDSEVLVVEQSLDVSVWGIPGHREFIKESVSFRVQNKIL